MSQDTHIEDSEPEEAMTKIVSYLDGELDDTQMVEVEQELVNDHTLRKEADLLSRTWEMLDSLQSLSGGQKFTQDTLATIAAETKSKPSEELSNPLKPFIQALARYRILPCFLLGLVGGIGGLAAGSFLLAEPENIETRTALDNFEMLRESDAYLIVPGVQQLRDLKAPDSSFTVSREEQP